MYFQKCLITNNLNADRGSTGDGAHYFNKESGLIFVDRGDNFECFHISSIPYGPAFKVKVKKDEPSVKLEDIGRNKPNISVVPDYKPKGKK